MKFFCRRIWYIHQPLLDRGPDFCKGIDASPPSSGFSGLLTMGWADLAILPGDGKAGDEDACV